MVRGAKKIRRVNVGDDFIEYTTTVSRQGPSLYVSIPKFLCSRVLHNDRVHIKITILEQKG